MISHCVCPIQEVNKYYSTKKAARVQMLNEMSNELGPSPSQSLSWKPASEVVGAAFQPFVNALSRQQQPEAVSEAAVEPADAVVDREDVLPKEEVGLSDVVPVPVQAGAFGTDEVYIGKGDGSGQSTKAPTQQLWNAAADKKQFDLQSGRRAFVQDERAFRKTNGKWMKAMPSYWNKAPVQQLFGLGAPFVDTAPRGAAPLLNPGAMGTNHAFLNRRGDRAGRTWYEGMGDGAGVSVRGRTQLLAQAGAARLPDAGELGTDRAFLAEKTNPGGARWFEGVGDGDGQSTAVRRADALATAEW
jgi:hypothetical protein